MLPSFTETAATADAGFWAVVGEAALRLNAQTSAEASLGAANAADLRALDVIVPSWAHAPLVRAALHIRLRPAGGTALAFIPPRIATLAAWVGGPWDAQRDDAIERRIELFDALRGNRWIRSTFGEQSTALWALSSHLAALCDELTFAAVHDAAAFEAQFRTSLTRHFFRRAAHAVEPAAQLVLQLWRAGLSGDGHERSGAAARLAALQARSQTADRPLLFVAALPPPSWTRGWLQALSERVPVHLIQADVGAAIAAQPLLAAAWPELRTRDESIQAPAPIAQRARALEPAAARAAPALIEAQSLEDEAVAVADQVVGWLNESCGRLDEGCNEGERKTRPLGETRQENRRSTRQPRIALVPLDRVCARRVRALLERAGVHVRDETGWKLSTTSAAGAVMRLFDLAANDFYYRDLLDWLKSPFTLHGVLDKAGGVEAIEKAIRGAGIVQGLGALLLTLADGGGDRGRHRSNAVRWLQLLEERTRGLRGGAAPVAALARSLDAALGALGMRAGLAADPVGHAVLRELDALCKQIIETRVTEHGDTETQRGSPRRVLLSPAEFCALLAERFEEVAIAGEAIDSPVVMVSLSAAALRDFDAAVLIGADAEHLPALPPGLLFFSAAVRADLGLRGPREAVRDQGHELAALLMRVPRVTVTWRSRHADEPRELAPWFARLRAVARAAGHDPVRAARATSGRVEWSVAPAPVLRPAPSAPQRLPARISASQYQSLVDCAYQFYARSLLQLQPLDEVTEDPDQRDYGEAVHAVLARFHREWGDAALHEQPRERLAASLAAHAAAVFDPLVQRLPRFLALRQQFDDLQPAYFDWLHARSADGWRFVEAESRYRTALALDVAGVPQNVELVGRIDRLDQRGNELELLDYKARRRAVLADRLAVSGEDVQLPFYGVLLARRATGAAYVALQRPGGSPAQGPRERDAGVAEVRAPQPFAPLVDAMQLRLREDLQRVASGHVLTAMGAEPVCRYCEMRGLCRRDYWPETGDAAA